MNPTVIDTLRYADRLKAAGVEPAQAEAMSRALNAELTEELVTKTDLDASTAALRTDLDASTAALRTDLDAATGALRTDLDAATGALRTELRELERKVDEGFAATDGKFAAMRAELAVMDAKFDGLSSQFATQGRYVFLVLAVIASLGLYNAVAPLVVGKASQQTGSSQPVAAKVEGDTAPAPTTAH